MYFGQFLALVEGPYGQRFEISDIASIAALVVLEALLSADNALVLAIMVKHLKKQEQKRALLYGLGGAFVFRFLAILFATVILKQWWLQAIGASYLVFISLKHFLKREEAEGEIKKKERSFWWTVIAVEVTDIAFAIDSVLAGISFIGNKSNKIWVVFFGAVIGIVLLRFAATFFIRILHKYPMLDHVAYAIVAWVGVKLAFISAHSWSLTHPESPQVPELPTPVFWAVLLSIAVFGTLVAQRHGVPTDQISDEMSDMIDDASDLHYNESELVENSEVPNPATSTESDSTLESR